MNSDSLNKEDKTDSEISEDSLRLALERLGSKTARGSAQSNHKKSPPDARRRRFVQEGQVVVEHHQMSRGAQRVMQASGNDEQNEEINRLRNLLKHEQRRAENAQRELSDLQVQMRTLETHLVHEKLHVTELRSRCAAAEQALLQSQVQFERQLEEANNRKLPSEPTQTDHPVTERKTRGPGRPPKNRETSIVEGEPEPVRWWKD